MSAIAAAERPNPVRAFLRLVMIEHSVFALPFAYLAALTAMKPDIQWGKLALISVALVSGSTVAMADTLVGGVFRRHDRGQWRRSSG